MKSLINILAMLMYVSIANAQFSGHIPILADTTWTLEGNSITPIKIKGDKFGHFTAEIKNLERGIYKFGIAGSFYLEPSYHLVVNAKNGSYSFKGIGATENQILQEIKPMLRKFLGNPAGYDIRFNYLLTEPNLFIPMLDDYITKSKLLSNKSNNTFFKDFIKQEVEFDKRYCLYVYNRFYGLDSSKMDALKKILAIPVAERKEDYRKNLMAAYQAQFSKKLTPEEKENLNKIIYEDWDMNNEFLLKNSKYYQNLIGYKIDYLAYGKNQKQLRDSLKNDNKVKLLVLQPLISNKNIKEQFSYRYTNAAIKEAKTPTEINDIYEAFLNNSNNIKHKEDIQKTYRNLSATLTNAIAPDFNYVNASGQMVSIKSLRGKYIYIDIWATWCAPCVAEIPSLKKLGKAYKDKNISFVSISVDKSNNKEYWLDFVKKNGLDGIQLMADQDFSSDFIKKFGISAIPRFILIDPDGRIIDNNAKRPSDPKLTAQLDMFNL